MLDITWSKNVALFLVTGFATGCGGGNLSMNSSAGTQIVAMQSVVAQEEMRPDEPTKHKHHALVYVSNEAANSITAYPLSASGNIAPLITIAGWRTRLDHPVGLTFDSNGNLYVVNHGFHRSSISIYAHHASGNVAPMGIIEGPQTHLRAQLAAPDYPTGAIAVDSASGHMFVGRVSNEHAPFSHNILVFNLSARGNAAPVGSIGVIDTLPNSTPPTLYGMEPAPALAIDERRSDPRLIAGMELEACCHGSDGWTYYDASSLTAGASLSYYTNAGLYGLGIDSISGNIVAAYSHEIDVWGNGISGTAEGQGGILPLRVISGGSLGFGALAVDSKQKIWALVRGSGNVLPFFIGADQINVYAPNSSTPVVITGPATGLSGASGIAVSSI